MQEYLNQLSHDLIFIKSNQINNTIHIYCETKKDPDRSVHSRFLRIVKDIPYGDINIEIHITAKKYFNERNNIKQLIVSEKFDFLSGPKGTRTKRLDEYLLKLSKETSAIGLERFIKDCGISVSDTTILRLVKKNDNSQS